MNLIFLLYRTYRAPRRLKKTLFIYWNRLLFKMAGVSFGKRMKIFNQVYINVASNSYISIGDDFKFTSGMFINPICRNLRGGVFVRPNACITIGNNVGISSACLWANNSITIGNNVNIGADCLIMDTDAHSLDFTIRRTPQDGLSASNAPIIIEDDVLIGAKCIILKGVTIGARSVIGAGSVVTKSIPSDCIAAGNPCKVIRTVKY